MMVHFDPKAEELRHLTEASNSQGEGIGAMVGW